MRSADSFSKGKISPYSMNGLFFYVRMVLPTPCLVQFLQDFFIKNLFLTALAVSRNSVFALCNIPSASFKRKMEVESFKQCDPALF